MQWAFLSTLAENTSFHVWSIYVAVVSQFYNYKTAKTVLKYAIGEDLHELDCASQPCLKHETLIESERKAWKDSVQVKVISREC